MSRAFWRAWPWLGLVARLVVGGVFLAAGALKLPDPAAALRAVRAYQILPEALVPAFGYGMPILEIVIGLMLIAGVTVRFSAAVASLLLVMFIGGVASAWARGLAIDCGCFGGGGEIAPEDTAYPAEIIRDGVLLVLSLALVRWPRTRWAADTLLGLWSHHDDEHGHDGEPDPDESGESGAHGNNEQGPGVAGVLAHERDDHLQRSPERDRHTRGASS